MVDGPKITIDVDVDEQGLEVIEALLGVSFDEIDVVVHPQSVVHSMVSYTDGRRSPNSRCRTCVCVSGMRCLPRSARVPYGDRLDHAWLFPTP